MASVSGGENMDLYLKGLAKKLNKDAYVKVGFLDETTYDRGQTVAEVAAYNEFGDPARGRPPRPFFRDMIAENERDWPRRMKDLLKQTDFNVEDSLNQLGSEVAAQLVRSIHDFMSPPLARSTVAKKGFEDPLIDTGLMVNSVDWEVIL